MAGKAPLDIAAFAGLVGHEVAIRLKGGESSAFSSVVFATDAARQLVVFRSSPVHTFAKGEYRVVAVGEIASVEDKGVSREPLPSLRAVTETEASRKLSEARGAGLKRQLSRGAYPLSCLFDCIPLRRYGCRGPQPRVEAARCSDDVDWSAWLVPRGLARSGGAAVTVAVDQGGVCLLVLASTPRRRLLLASGSPLGSPW